MKYKTNFKFLILGHVSTIVLLIGFLFFVHGEAAIVLKWILGVLFVSMVIQWILFKIKPGWFIDKINRYPNN